MSQLTVEAEGSTRAGPDVVWSLVANANRYPQWGPWNDGGYRPASPGPSKQGSVQWFRYGRRTTSVEQILEVDEPRRVVYKVVNGLPVKNYRAEVTLTPTSTGGTSIRWAASWDKTLLGSLVRRKLAVLYPDIVAALVAAADQQVATSSRQDSRG
ncbi:MAG: SRPBCC family protein [Actinomycetota bacterium]|nr:SRPBCC family protein [Actinomycetota bacterium]